LHPIAIKSFSLHAPILKRQKRNATKANSWPVNKSNKCTHACMHACKHTCTHTHTTILQLSGLCPGQPGWAGTRRYISPSSETHL